MTTTFFATSDMPSKVTFRDGSVASVGSDGTFSVPDKYVSDALNAGFHLLAPRGTMASMRAAHAIERYI